MKKVARLRMPQVETNFSYNLNINASSGGGNSTPTKTMAAEGTVRTTGRIKKPKLVFDPSDYDVPRPVRVSNVGAAHITAHSATNSSERYSSGSSTSQTSEHKKSTRSPGSSPAVPESADICSVCSKRDAKRGIHAKNKLIHCQDCDKKIHKLCLPVDFEDIDVLMKYYKCPNCRSCVECNTFNETENEPFKDLIICAKCVKSYHLQCHAPPVLKYQQYMRNWKCSKCLQPKIDEIREIIGSETAHFNTTNNNIEKVAKSESLHEQHKQQEHEKKTVAHLKDAGKRSTSSTFEQQQPQEPLQLASKEKEQIQKPKQQEALIHKKHLAVQEPIQLQKILVQNHQPLAEKDNKKFVKNESNLTQPILNGESNIAAKKLKQSFGPVVETNAVVDEHSNSSTTLSLYSSTDAIDIPTDVKYWSVDKVFEYFGKYFPNEAHVFKDQEIDGMSLLLLKRSDVVKKLPIKLGPSLRLYNLILKIQAQVNDPTLGWNVGQ